MVKPKKVSLRWQKRFAVIDQLLPAEPASRWESRFYKLPYRIKSPVGPAQFSFLFGPIYYCAYGMVRKGFVLFLVETIAIDFVSFLCPSIIHSSGFFYIVAGASLIFPTNFVADYYKYVHFGETNYNLFYEDKDNPPTKKHMIQLVYEWISWGPILFVLIVAAIALGILTADYSINGIFPWWNNGGEYPGAPG